MASEDRRDRQRNGREGSGGEKKNDPDFKLAEPESNLLSSRFLQEMKTSFDIGSASQYSQPPLPLWRLGNLSTVLAGILIKRVD
jgi:hypothetical protein